MNIIKDYIGQKYGELTIIKEQPIHITSSGLERRQFRVQCSCGYEYDISLEGAKRGNKCINCREKRKNISKSKTTNEYIGKRYGKLVVKSVADDYISPSGRTKIRFNCLCDCGKEKIVDIYSLKSKVRSCGCNNYETFIKWCNENGREDLFDLWDYENNCEQLEVISSSGKKKYNWRCTNGHTWEASTDQVKRLKRETLCPVCSGRKINVGENDFSTEHPELIEEWDYEKNKDKRPEDYRPGSAERIWWKCRKGHSWQTAISKRTKGSKCPYCSGMRVKSGENDLETLFPDIAAQWVYEKNDNVNPNSIGITSHDKYWWRCKEGHEWRTSVATRTRGNNCPICSKIGTSIPEQTVMYYLSKTYNCVNRDKSLGVEFDIYIPDKQVAIEYDGKAFHASEASFERDTKKNALCAQNNIHLYRIRESGCHKMEATDNVTILNCKYRDNSSLKKCIEKIFQDFGLECDVNIDRDRIEIVEQYYKSDDKNSLSIVRPDLAKEWHPQKNGNLTPDKISYGSEIVVWWKGECGHEFQKSPNARRMVSTCPYCVKTRLVVGVNDLQTKNALLLNEWDYEKNVIFPNQISSRSTKKVWWKGECGHSWKASIVSRATGSKCPYCSGRYAIAGVNDIETTHPGELVDWDYEKNITKPSEVKAGSDIIVHWKCHICGCLYTKKVIDKIKQKNPCPSCYPSKVKKVLNVDTGEVFSNLVEAAEKYKLSKSNICNCCKKKTKTCGGYRWAYFEEKKV